jgi:hypothetical protein
MALAIGPVAIAFFFLALLTLVTIYWLLTQWKTFAATIPVVGSALASLSQWLLDRNMEIINQLLTVGHSLISWSIDMVHIGFQALHNLYNAAVVSQLSAFGNGINGLQFWKDNVATAAITSLQATATTLQAWKTTFVDININAFAFWKTQTEQLLANVVLPQLDKLTVATNIVMGTTIPALQSTANSINARIDLLITTTIGALRKDLGDLQITTEAALANPTTGVLPRVGALEGEIAQVLPWAAVIGLTIPAAINLAKLAKDPCYCTNSGSYQDNGVYELAALMDLF